MPYVEDFDLFTVFSNSLRATANTKENSLKIWTFPVAPLDANWRVNITMVIPHATILFTILVTKTANFYHPPIELVIWSGDLQIHLLKTAVKIQVNKPL